MSRRTSSVRKRNSSSVRKSNSSSVRKSSWRSGYLQLPIAIPSAVIFAMAVVFVVIVGEAVDFHSVPARIAAVIGVAAGILMRELFERKNVSRRTFCVERLDRNLEEYPHEPNTTRELVSVNLESYLKLNLSQVRSIYWLTVVAMALGFLFIGLGVLRVFYDPHAVTGALLSAVSGVLVSSIGATFLVVFRSTMTQAKNYVTVIERISAVGMADQMLKGLSSADTNLRDQATAEIVKELLKIYGPKNLHS